MAFQEAEIGVDNLAFTRELHNKSKPPGNPIGEWMDWFSDKRNIPINTLGQIFDLPGISYIRTKAAENLSLYSIQTIIEGFSQLSPEPDEIDLLADATHQTIAYRMKVKGNIYDRVPPTVARSKQSKIPDGTYTNTQLAKAVGVGSGKIHTIKRLLGIETLVFTKDDADRIKNHLDKLHKAQSDRDRQKNEFAGTARRLPKNEGGTTVVKRAARKRKAPERKENQNILEMFPNEVIKIRLEYPNVLTPEYLASLTSIERKSVQVLAGSSISHQVVISDDAQKAVEYLIKERIYPPGARIRMRTNGNECSYYFEYGR